MRLLSLLIFILFNSAHALDLGDGSDGVCNLNGGTITDTQFQCLELNVSGVNTFTGLSNIIIRVQGDVNIQGELIVSSTGILGRAGGFNGGNGGATAAGSPGGAPADFPDAAGMGGQGYGSTTSPEGCSGASGSGGQHHQIDSPASGSNASNSPSLECDDPAGGLAPNQPYGNPLTLHQGIFGGSGGGGGGAGFNGAGDVQGGAGGAGGGVLIIYSGGNITLDGAIIRANGAPGNGGNLTLAPTHYSGAGGGGAGGAVLLASLGSIDIITSSTIEAIGGVGGTNPNGVNGSAGGRGIIRLEDDDGQIDIAQLITNTTPISTGLNPIAASQAGGSDQQLVTTSDISAGCAIREQSSSGILTLIFLVIMLLLTGSIGRSSKIQKASCAR